MNINEIQRLVLSVVSNWSKQNRNPIPQQVIVNSLVLSHHVKPSTVKGSIKVLCVKGYLRSAIKRGSYIQLRTINL